MTSDPGSIRRALARAPWTGVGTSPLPALMAGLQQLAYAHIADGAVILLSDGAATGASKLTPQSVGAAALAQHARIFTVGLSDRSFAPDLMRQVAQAGGGTFVAADGAQLPSVVTHLTSALAHSFLLRYRSILTGGQAVAVTVKVDGVPGLLHLSYNAPGVPAPPGTTTSGATTGGATTGGATAGGATAGGTTAAPTATSRTATTAAPSSGSRTSRATPSRTRTSGAKTRAAAPVPSGTTLSSLTSAPSAAGHTSLPSWWSKLSTKSSTLQGASRNLVLEPAGRHSALGKAQSFGAAPGWVAPARNPSFWSSSLAVILIAGTCALLLGLGITVLLVRRPGRRALQQRVGTFTLASSDEPAIPTRAQGGPVARLLTRRRWWPAFAERVDGARMKRSPLALVKRTAMFSVVGALLLALVTGSILPGIFLLIVAPFILRTLVSRGARKQRKRFSEQLPSNLQDLAGAMRAGRSFAGAMSGIVESANEPIRGEFERAVADERLGLPLEETLEAIGRRMEAKDMEQVALIASLNRQSGSNVAEALDRVAESARERADLGREMQALTGQARMSAYVLTGMPPALLVALTFLAPQYQKPLFHTTMGIVLLFFSAGLLGAGWVVMSKIVKPEV
jgi:Flp pilus assembly protein TadB